jgi:hypothetical protein
MELRFQARPANTDPKMKIEKPRIYTFFLPMVSPSLPQIGTKIALARIYAVAIQLA